MVQVYVLSWDTAPDFTVSVPVWLFVAGSYDPDDGTKLSDTVKSDHAMDICSDMLVILQVMMVSVPRKFSLLVVLIAEIKFRLRRDDK